MKPPGKLSEKRVASWLVIALALIALASLRAPNHFAIGKAIFLPLHTFLEAGAVLTAMLIFIVGINRPKEKVTDKLALLTSAFLLVGLLDFAHTLSYAGMPDFVTPSGAEKAIYFWLAARMTAALALLAVAMLPGKRKIGVLPRAGYLATALVLAVALYWAILFRQPGLPHVFDVAAGPTPFKQDMEYLIAGIYAVIALIFYRHKQPSRFFDVDLLFAATAVMGLSELFFVSYADVTDTLNLWGHLYKIIAYYLLYRAIVAHALRAPYQQLIQSERHLRESEERYRLIIETSTEGIWLIDSHSTTIFANPRMAEMLGYANAEQMIGHPLFDFLDEKDKAHAASNMERCHQGVSEQHEFRFRRRDESEIWARLSASPIFQDGECIGALAMVTDITASKRAAQKIADLKRRNELILNAAGEGICGIDTQGMIIFANPAAATMLGYQVEELLGLPLHDVSHHTRPDGSPYPAADCPILASFICGINCHEGDEFYWRKDGSSFPVEYTSTPIVDEGETIGAVVMFSDISRRKRIEELLQESEKRFRTLFGSIQDAIFVLPILPDGATGKFIEVNEIACRILGYSREELLNMTIADVDAPDADVDAVPVIRRLVAGESVIFEQVHITRDGRRIPVEVNANPFILAGQPVIMALTRNISERKQAEAALRLSEERYRSTFEQAAVGIAHAELDGYYRKLNQKFCEIVGYSHEELLHMTFRDITFPDDLEKDLDYVRSALAGDIATFTMEKRYVRKDRALVWVSLTVTLLRKADDAPDYFIAVIEDITESKRVAQQLRDLSDHLQTVREEEKARIAREIHDDLGGTLTALKMDVHWLLRKLPPNAESAPFIERAELMSQLLDNAVGVTRRIITELRPTILDDLGLLAALEWQCEQFEKRIGIECRVICAADKGQLDKDRSIALFRIFQEALTNVVRHAGASRVEVAFYHGDDAVSLRVSDNGCGLSLENRDDAFRYGIRGMEERARSLGGHVSFESPAVGGLTITAILPLNNPTLEETP